MSSLALQALERLETKPAVTDERELVDWLLQAPKDIPHAEWASAWDKIADLLLVSRSPKVRNAAALALADMACPCAEATINAVLAREDVALTAGTLLYALDELKARVTLPSVLNIVRSGSYEARAELMILLDKGRLLPPDELDISRADAELSVLAAGGDEETREAAGLARELLGQAKSAG